MLGLAESIRGATRRLPIESFKSSGRRNFPEDDAMSRSFVDPWILGLLSLFSTSLLRAEPLPGYDVLGLAQYCERF